MKQLWNDNFNYMKTLGMESVSGTGSTLDSTKRIRQELPALLKALNIWTLLDVPCGDAYWMGKVDFGKTEYYGADIVEENIVKNVWKNTMHVSAAKTFFMCDITDDPFGEYDMVFCRDCLVHFSNEDVWKALKNIVASGSKYLMTTTFRDRKENHDIPTGGWRTLNLEIAPFNFPEPDLYLDENCQEQDGAYIDKSLGVWKIDDIRTLVNNAS